MFETQRKLAWASLKSGVVISLSLFFLFIAFFFSGNIASLFIKKADLYAKIPNIQGLRSGAPVWLYGAEIGKVDKLKITDDGIIISISLEKKYSRLIHKDATAAVMTMGILGDKFIEIKPGTLQTDLITKNDTISGISSVDFDQITSVAFTTITQIDTVIAQLAQLLNNITHSTGSFAQLLNDSTLYKQLALTAQNLSNLTNNVKKSDGTFKMLVNDPELYNNLNDAAQRMVSLMSQIGKDNGDGNGGVASAIVNDSTMASNLRDAIASLKATTHSANELIIDIKNNPKKYLSFKVF